MYKKLISVLTIVLFLVCLTVLLICNFGAFKAGVAGYFKSEDKGGGNISDQVENHLKSSFPLKSLTHEGYGLGLLAVNKKIVGNYEYTKLSDGSVVMTNHIDNTDAFTESVIKLNDHLMSENIPLVYVQMPYRTMTDGENAVSGNDTFTSLMSSMCDIFESSGVDVLDLNKNERIQSIDPIYFSSDIHQTTEYEFTSAEIITGYLEDNYGLAFPEKDKVFDKSQYSISSYTLYGNTTFNTGHIYSPGDTFEIYHPLYPTDMRLYDYSDGTEKTGTYDDVCLNGYENNADTDSPYWVTNYLRWPSPYYDVINNANEQSPKLLIICDSGYLRGCSFLSLASGAVTIYDPRYDGGYYLDSALSSHDYDAVIVTGCSFYYVPINSDLHTSELSAEIISAELSDDNNILEVTVKNSSSSAWSESDMIRCCLWVNNEDWGIRACIPEGREVASGESFTFRFENISESIGKAETAEVQMLKECVKYFGEKKTVIS